MRLGVIDVGSNTVHLLVVDVHRGARPLPAASRGEALRLSENIGADGVIATRSVRELVAFTKMAVDLAADEGVGQLMILATSAVRDAANGPEVLAEVASLADAEVRVLSGVDEARHTFLAARRWYGWSAGTLLVLDIGGGSLEMALGMDEEPDVALSVPLGAGRVTRNLLDGDPPSPETIAAARRQIRTSLASSVRPLLRGPQPDRVVATSKTFRSLARLGGAAASSEGPHVVRTLDRDVVTSLVARLGRLTAAERTQLPGVSAVRSRQVLGGALVAEAALDLLRVDQVEICPWALREGVLLRRIEALADEGVASASADPPT